MTESATGLILRTRPLTETSLIVHWLTPNIGRIATVAKGARRPKSPLSGKLDLFYLADFSFARSRRSELHTLREVSVRETNAVLRNELGWVWQASYCAALIEQTTEMDTPLPAIFDLMKGLLSCLPKQPAEAKTIFAFEMQLLRELGLAPKLTSDSNRASSPRDEGVRRGLRRGASDQNEPPLLRRTEEREPFAVRHPGTAKVLMELARLDWAGLSRLKISEAQEREMKQFLHGFLIFHLGKMPKGRNAALQSKDW